MPSLLSKHLLSFDAMTILDGFTRATDGIEPVLDDILAHRPHLFVAMGPGRESVAWDLARLISPDGRADQGRAWGFSIKGGVVDLSIEPFHFVDRCSWECTRRAVSAYLTGVKDGKVVVILNKGAAQFQFCASRQTHRMEAN